MLPKSLKIEVWGKVLGSSWVLLTSTKNLPKSFLENPGLERFWAALGRYWATESVQNISKTLQDAPKTSQDSPWTCPGPPQGAPRYLQDAVKSTRNQPKTRQDGRQDVTLYDFEGSSEQK